jgi:hypothetical protein
MTELFDRVADVTIDRMRLTGHRVAFRVEKSLKPEPNTCELQVWGLNEDQRAGLEELQPKKESKRGIPVRIEAGYKGGASLIWLGDLRTAVSVKEGPDWVTALSSGDGEKAYQSARVALSYGPKTPIDTALRAMVRALGVDEGNVSQVAAQLRLRGVGKLLSQGAVISGPAARQLTDWARAADLEWSIQDGAIQFVDRGKALLGKAVRITSDTGMIGSPTVDNDGVLTVTVLMMPDVKPGTLLVVDSRRIKGNYRVEQATWDGDSFGGSWQITLTASRF